jgi:hypothetical protein
MISSVTTTNNSVDRTRSYHRAMVAPSSLLAASIIRPSTPGELFIVRTKKRNPYATSLTRVLHAARSLDLHHPLKNDKNQQ